MDARYNMLTLTDAAHSRKRKPRVANAIAAINWNNYIELLYKNAITIDGLPNDLDKNMRYINNCRYWRGRMLFFEHPQYGPMLTEFEETGQLNPYYEPIVCRAIWNGGDYLTTDFVIVRENEMGYPPELWCREYAQKLADISRTIDVLEKSMKRPVIIRCDDDSKLTYSVLQNMVADNEAYVIVNKNTAISAFDVLPIEPRIDVYHGLWQGKHEIMNEWLTRVGIYNSNSEKRERLITQEADANNMLTDASIMTVTDSLTRCFDEVNERFGYNISVNANKPAEMGGEELDEPGMADSEAGGRD